MVMAELIRFVKLSFFDPLNHSIAAAKLRIL